MTHQTRPVPSGGSGGGTRFLENLAYLVPGYRGYKDKELRREEDARLRGRVLAKLQVMRALLEDRLAELAADRLDGRVDLVDRRLRRLETLADTVRYAPYGFSGFFDVDKVREDTLERLLETDLLLFQDLDDAVEHLRAAPFPPPSAEAFASLLAAIDKDIEQIETRLVTRDKILGDR